jgi:hypothetical protein
MLNLENILINNAYWNLQYWQILIWASYLWNKTMKKLCYRIFNEYLGFDTFCGEDPILLSLFLWKLKSEKTESVKNAQNNKI